MITIKNKTKKAGKFVNTDHVDSVIRNYKQERWVHNSRRLGKEDSLSVWYSVEELEEFLATVRNNGGDGVRMYFGAYDKEKAPLPLYAGRQTIVMVATKVKETASGETNKDIYINTDNGNSVLAYNLGKICPPFCIETGDGDFEEIGISIIDKGKEGIIVV
jgi:hypothetical protein